MDEKTSRPWFEIVKSSFLNEVLNLHLYTHLWNKYEQ
jgi:hypothetical protein